MSPPSTLGKRCWRGTTERWCAPAPAPRGRGPAERWVRTVREECLDWTLVLGRHRLEAVLRDYVRHYNQHRPHHGLRLQVPAPLSEVTSARLSLSDIGRHDMLGGLIHEYSAAAQSSFTPAGLSRPQGAPFAVTGIGRLYWTTGPRQRNRCSSPATFKDTPGRSSRSRPISGASTSAIGILVPYTSDAIAAHATPCPRNVHVEKLCERSNSQVA